MRSVLIVSLSVLLGGLAGCFSQPDANNTYPCNVQSDCISGYSCVEAPYKGEGLWCIRVSDLAAGDALTPDDTAGTTTSGSVPGDTSGTLPEDTFGSTTSGSTPGDTSGTLPGEDTSGTTTSSACQNPADRGYLSGTIDSGMYAGQNGDMAARDAATTCGLANIAAPDPLAYTVTCMEGEPHEIGLSRACSACFGALFLCGIERCLQQCAPDPGGRICLICLGEQGCQSEFSQCSGL